MLLFVNFLTRLTQVNVITGIILCALGLALVLLARKFVLVYKKGEEVRANDKLYLSLKAVGLIMMCIALVITIIE